MLELVLGEDEGLVRELAVGLRALGVVVAMDCEDPINRNGLVPVVVEIDSSTETSRGQFSRCVQDIMTPDSHDAFWIPHRRRFVLLAPQVPGGRRTFGGGTAETGGGN